MDACPGNTPSILRGGARVHLYQKSQKFHPNGARPGVPPLPFQRKFPGDMAAIPRIPSNRTPALRPDDYLVEHAGGGRTTIGEHQRRARVASLGGADILP